MNSRKNTTTYRCQQCGYQSRKWLGRCPDCGGWNCLTEEVAVASPVVLTPGDKPVPLHQAPESDEERAVTGIGELDRVLGGGIVPGSVTLIGGEPGIGKSTLLLHLLAEFAEQGKTVLYVSGEESARQIKMRARRLGAIHPGEYLATDNAE